MGVRHELVVTGINWAGGALVPPPGFGKEEEEQLQQRHRKMWGRRARKRGRGKMKNKRWIFLVL